MMRTIGSLLHSRLRGLLKSLKALTGSKPVFRPADLGEADVDKLSVHELLAYMRHDAHRIEKAFYNKIFFKKRAYYKTRKENVDKALASLAQRKFDLSEPTTAWASRIARDFDQLENTFIAENSTMASPIDVSAANRFVELAGGRRSSRVWSMDQPAAEELAEFARLMIDAARWAPTSGNRQAWRFRIMTADREKMLLEGLKEEHCFKAPCLIFVGMDRRVYGALGSSEAGLHIDAGAASMLMVLTAHAAHFGVCWNHFSRDLIESREVNRRIYNLFAKSIGIPSYIEPVSIIAFGKAAFHPPVPPRMEHELLLLGAVD